MRPPVAKAESCKSCPRYGAARCTPSTIDTGGVIDILIVCDQPDLISASNNMPLYGHSGHVVNTALKFLTQSSKAYAGLKLRTTYAVQCVDDKESPATRVMLEACRVNLDATILLFPPKLIIALGAGPLRALGLKGKHKDLHGRITTSARYKLPVFVTLSEKALLAQPGLFETFKLDLKNAYDFVCGTRVVATLEELSKSYILPETVEEVQAVCASILDYAGRGHPMDWAVSVDTEGTSLHPEKLGSKVIAFCFAWDTGKATTIIYDHPGAAPEYLARLDEVKAAVHSVLASAKPKIFHNAKFDLKFIENKLGFTVNSVKWDTLLGEHLLDEDKKGNYGLKGLTAGWLPKYCGYEDRLHDFLESKEQTDSVESLDRHIRELEIGLTPEQKCYLEDLAAYKLKLLAYDADSVDHAARVAKYDLDLIEYSRVSTEYEEAVNIWSASARLGHKPKMTLKKPKKVPRLIRPKQPKDPRSKKERKINTDAGFELIPIRDLALYGAVDADVTRQLAKLQIARIAKEASQVDTLMYTHAIPVSRMLGRAEFHGTRIDQNYIEVLDKGLTKIIEDCEVELYQMVGTTQYSGKPLNIASNQQMGNVLYNWGWTHPDGTHMAPYKVTDVTTHGLPSTADKTLKQYLAYEDDEKEIPVKEAYLIERYGRWKKAKKAKETFLTNIRLLSRRDGFLHTNFHINGTGTGRLSSSDMNLQNIPKYLAGWNIKKLFIPSSDDMLICNCDYKGAEVRVFTVYAKDKGLIDAINDGMDMHCYFAARVFKRPYEDYDNRDNPVLITDPMYRKLLNQERTNIKRVVFGILYGAGPYKIAETIGVTVEIAKQLIRLLYDIFKALEQYGIDIEKEVRLNGFVDTMFGRRRRFPLKGLSRHANRAFRQAKNFKIQSTSSDIVMGQVVEIEEPLRRDMRGNMLMTVHDSAVFEFPKKYLGQLEDFLTYYGQQRVAEKYAWLPVPFKLDIEVGRSYGEVQPITTYIKEHPFKPTPEGVLEEQELLNDLRNDAFEAA